MSKIESRIGVIKYNDEKVYSFISDFSNFSNLIPGDKITDWQADREKCSFSIAGIGRAGLKYVEKDPFKLIKIASDENTPMHLTMWIQLKNTGENETKVKVTIEPDVNSVMMMMIKNPLEQFLERLVNEMEKFRF